jgi:hypothetical protein
MSFELRGIVTVVMIGLLVCGSMAGCAGLFQWSPKAQAVLSTLDQYYQKYASGVAKEAPAIIAEGAQLLGANSQVVTDASAAVNALQGAAQGLDLIAQAGAGTNNAETNVQASINGVNSAVGAVQQAVAQAAAGN